MPDIGRSPKFNPDTLNELQREKYDDLVIKLVRKMDAESDSGDEHFDEEAAITEVAQILGVDRDVLAYEIRKQSIDTATRRLIDSYKVKTLEDGSTVGYYTEATYYNRALVNGDVLDFFNGEKDPLDIGSKLFRLKDGSYTSVLTREGLKNGDYSADMRYILRAFIGNLISNGSKKERLAALYIAKDWVNQGYIYDGVCEIQLNADAMNMIFQNGGKSDIYAAGKKKPEGHSGRGISRSIVKENVDNIQDEKLKDLVYNNKKGEKKKSSYDELGIIEQGVLDGMNDYMTSLIKGKGGAAINDLDGDDQKDVLVKVFKVLKRIYQTGDLAAARMMEIKGNNFESIRESLKEHSQYTENLLSDYTNTAQSQNLSFALRKAMEGFIEVVNNDIMQPEQKAA